MAFSDEPSRSTTYTVAPSFVDSGGPPAVDSARRAGNEPEPRAVGGCWVRTPSDLSDRGAMTTRQPSEQRNFPVAIAGGANPHRVPPTDTLAADWLPCDDLHHQLPLIAVIITIRGTRCRIYNPVRKPDLDRITIASGSASVKYAWRARMRRAVPGRSPLRVINRSFHP